MFKTRSRQTKKTSRKTLNKYHFQKTKCKASTLKNKRREGGGSTTTITEPDILDTMKQLFSNDAINYMNTKIQQMLDSGKIDMDLLDIHIGNIRKNDYGHFYDNIRYQLYNVYNVVDGDSQYFYKNLDEIVKLQTSYRLLMQETPDKFLLFSDLNMMLQNGNLNYSLGIYRLRFFRKLRSRRRP